MESRIAIIGIIVEKRESADELNKLLSDYGDYIIGRMGIPYRERGINVIGIVMDGSQDTINALSGKIGKIDGISAKTTYSQMTFKD